MAKKKTLVELDFKTRTGSITKIKNKAYRRTQRNNHIVENSLQPIDVSLCLDETHCIYCGNYVLSYDRTIDHIIPLSRGGSNIKANIVMACEDCNGKKSCLTASEFFQIKDSTEKLKSTHRILGKKVQPIMHIRNKILTCLNL